MKPSNPNVLILLCWLASNDGTAQDEDFKGHYLCINEIDVAQVAELSISEKKFKLGNKEYISSSSVNPRQAEDCDLMTSFWEFDSVLNSLCFQGEERKMIGTSHTPTGHGKVLDKMIFNCSKLD